MRKVKTDAMNCYAEKKLVECAFKVNACRRARASALKLNAMKGMECASKVYA